MWLASDVLLYPLDQGNQVLPSLDLLTNNRRNFQVAIEGIKEENLIAEPSGAQFGILIRDSFYIYKIDGALLQDPIKRSFIAVTWLTLAAKR
jgi:hypothetical protein